jgi:hypothetical protein
VIKKTKKDCGRSANTNNSLTIDNETVDVEFCRDSPNKKRRLLDPELHVERSSNNGSLEATDVLTPRDTTLSPHDIRSHQPPETPPCSETALGIDILRRFQASLSPFLQTAETDDHCSSSRTTTTTNDAVQNDAPSSPHHHHHSISISSDLSKLNDEQLRKAQSLSCQMLAHVTNLLNCSSSSSSSRVLF